MNNKKRSLSITNYVSNKKRKLTENKYILNTEHKIKDPPKPPLPLLQTFDKCHSKFICNKCQKIKLNTACENMHIYCEQCEWENDKIFNQIDNNKLDIFSISNIPSTRIT